LRYGVPNAAFAHVFQISPAPGVAGDRRVDPSSSQWGLRRTGGPFGFAQGRRGTRVCFRASVPSAGAPVCPHGKTGRRNGTACHAIVPQGGTTAGDHSLRKRVTTRDMPWGTPSRRRAAMADKPWRSGENGRCSDGWHAQVPPWGAWPCSSGDLGQTRPIPRHGLRDIPRLCRGPGRK